uniref:Photosystem II reaction center protein Psb30 n=2 Tax=Cyanidiaceae TaxID=265316 RepID=A0A7G5VUT6_9RHOD|nr:hypothetical protein I9961_pgp064 [Cyanidiococcus yangmingshanensis]AIA61080.1 hypothetical protein [Cyanidiaceae sp. MX-AZ01]UNJ15479.1 photosystem II protein Psb30 [Cyanidioschyzonaceae sp. 1]UNJ15872.1 photosystem II protein Psb30 [Cyanidioschyzonaceae sp. 2]UNJ16068.1 photosystem II protein Psb30 [Cyanidioschyzonaceae sp. 3]QMX77453.1 hypothetical protein [Cyanidiococcus yangmingshanensis]
MNWHVIAQLTVLALVIAAGPITLIWLSNKKDALL